LLCVFSVATVFNVEDESRRYTVSEAARVLGITEAAVRARINRGKLQSEKIDNTVYVRLDSDTTPVHSGDQSTLVEALRDQVAMLKQQLNTEQEASAELRRIIAALTSRIPELPPASSQDPSESPETATDMPMGATPLEASEAPQEPTEGVSWWRRVFGG
jgi:predicted transcriptional regulator